MEIATLEEYRGDLEYLLSSMNNRECLNPRFYSKVKRLSDLLDEMKKRRNEVASSIVGKSPSQKSKVKVINGLKITATSVFDKIVVDEEKVPNSMRRWVLDTKAVNEFIKENPGVDIAEEIGVAEQFKFERVSISMDKPKKKAVPANPDLLVGKNPLNGVKFKSRN